MDTTTTILLIALSICHFLADYTHLSTAWMLDAKRLGTPLFPIFIHALIHASLMGIVLEIYSYNTIPNYNPFERCFSTVDVLFLFQLFTHFAIDVWKGKMNGWFPSLQSPANKWHWIVFGYDQLMHAIVIILMVQYITNN
jgi:branched-subunit amino acid ABC-type transport system permease component